MNWSHALRQVEPRPWLVRVDPRLKLLWVATISIGCIWFDSVAMLAALCLVAACPLFAIRFPWRAAAAYAFLVLLVIWSTVSSQGLFYFDTSRPPLFTIVPAFTWLGRNYSGLHFYTEGARYGAGQSLRFVANLLAGSSVALSTSPERLMAALVRLRIPTPLSYMGTAALRSIPLALEEWAALRQAYQLRTGRRGVGRFQLPRIRLLEELRLLEPLLANTLRRASALAFAVQARGFDPRQPRTHFPPLRMRAWEKVACALLVGLWIAALTFSLAKS